MNGEAVVLGFDILMLVCAMAMVGQGTLVFGKAVLAVAALMASFGPVIAVANLGTTLQQTLASGARVLDLLDEKAPAFYEKHGYQLFAKLEPAMANYNQYFFQKLLDLE